MTVVTLKGKTDKNGVLTITHPALIPQKEVEVTVAFDDKAQNHYDFSDLAGKLSLKEDGLIWQKTIRNEWE